MTEPYYASEYYDYNYDYTFHSWFAYTLTDLVLQMVLGTISILASSTILLLIFKSSTGLTSAYHRIMALLSFFDIMFSLGFVLSTIPMPKSTIPYRGPTLGTDSTCTAQAFILYIGAGGSFQTYFCLVGYYICTAFRVSETFIKKVYIPIFFIYICLIEIGYQVIAYRHGFLNIQHWSPHCGLSPIPSSCWDENGPTGGVDCLWPTRPHPYFTMADFNKYYTIFVFSFIIVGIAIIIFIVYRNEKKRNMDNTDGETSARLKQTRLTAFQGTMYVIAFIITWSLYLIPWDQNSPEYVDILESVLLPVQGVWNMLIFVYFKIYLIRQSDKSIASNYTALKILLQKPENIPEMVLSGIEQVKNDHFFDEGEDGILDAEAHSSKSSTQLASNPSAYDGLSNDTPPVGSKGLSSICKLDISATSSLKKIPAALNESTTCVAAFRQDQDGVSTGLSYGVSLDSSRMQVQDESSEGLSYGPASYK